MSCPLFQALSLDSTGTTEASVKRKEQSPTAARRIEELPLFYSFHLSQILSTCVETRPSLFLFTPLFVCRSSLSYVLSLSLSLSLSLFLTLSLSHSLSRLRWLLELLPNPLTPYLDSKEKLSFMSLLLLDARSFYVHENERERERERESTRYKSLFLGLFQS